MARGRKYLGDKARRKTIPVRVRAETVEKLKEIAEFQGEGVSKIIRAAIKAEIEYFDEVQEDESRK